MRDVKDQMQDYWSGIVSDLPEPSLESARQERIGDGEVRPLQPRRTSRLRTNWATAGVAFAAVLLIGGVIWVLGLGRDSAQVTDGGPVTTVAPPTTPAPPTTAISIDSASEGGGVLHAEWTLEATYDGWLEPVAFDGGFAAIRRLDPMREAFVEVEGGGDHRSALINSGEASVGEIWLSSDGVNWGPAPEQPPDLPWNLTSDGETLFAEAGDLFGGTGTIWTSTTGSDWQSALLVYEYGRLYDFGEQYDGWSALAGTVVAGPPGAVVFGLDLDGDPAAWVFDGDRFVPADAATVAALPRDGFEVVALHDRFLLYTYDMTRYESSITMKVSYSATGEVWGNLEPKPSDGPLERPEARVSQVASSAGMSLVALDQGYGLWATPDGSSWDEISLLWREDGWLPQVAGGEYGWIVYSPPHQESIYSSRPDYRNQGLWFSADAESWIDVDDFGPFGDTPATTTIVRDDHILVFAGIARGDMAWGLMPEDPATHVWRLDLSAPSPPGGSRVTISLDEVEGLEGLHVAAWLLPESTAGSAAPLGGTNWFGDPLVPQIEQFIAGYGEIRESPYSASDVIHPMRESVSRWVTSGVVAVAPGRYRLLVEAVESADKAARYACEIPIEVIAGESLLVTITDLPDFRDDPGRWTSGPDRQYPGCSG